MPVIRWAIVNTDGELMGQESGLHVSSSSDSFDKVNAPSGYRKVLLNQDDYERLKGSFNHKTGIYECCTDLIESKITDLTEERKTINNKIAKPDVLIREVRQGDGSTHVSRIDRRTKKILSTEVRPKKRAE